jgi:hypothetical protein
MCIFVVLCVDETHTVVGRDYRLSNFWLAKEVNKELKKKLLHKCL